MEFAINYLSIPISILSGLLAWLLAMQLQNLLVRHRLGQEITWSNQCGQKIEPLPTKSPWLYVIAAILLMAPVCFFFGFGIQMTYVFLMLTMFLAVSLVDIKYRLIPNLFVAGIFAIHILWLFVPFLYGVLPDIWMNLLNAAIGMLLCFAVFFGGTVLTGGKVGMGDVKLSMAIGFMLGWKSALIAIALSGLLMIPLVFTQPGMSVRMCFKQMVPFGPPFSLAAMLVLIAGFTPLAPHLLI